MVCSPSVSPELLAGVEEGAQFVGEPSNKIHHGVEDDERSSKLASDFIGDARSRYNCSLEFPGDRTLTSDLRS